MKKPLILFIGFFLLSAIAITSMYSAHMEPVRFSANGVVNSIEWDSRNHGMPVIEIRSENGRIKRFSSNRITLKPQQLVVGDLFRKIKDSKFCEVNGITVLCVN